MAVNILASGGQKIILDIQCSEAGIGYNQEQEEALEEGSTYNY